MDSELMELLFRTCCWAENKWVKVCNKSVQSFKCNVNVIGPLEQGFYLGLK